MNPEINEFGTKFWFDSDGKYHREDGPAAEWSNGNKWWCKHGQFHREDGPAIKWTRGGKWFIHGKLHREDGPAIDYHNGYKYYYLEGIKYTEEEYWEKIKELNKCKLFNLEGKKIEWL